MGCVSFHSFQAAMIIMSSASIFAKSRTSASDTDVKDEPEEDERDDDAASRGSKEEKRRSSRP